MKRHMKHVKYTIPLLAILFGLIFVFGPSFSQCSVWEDLTGTGKKKDNSWLWLLLLVNQGGGTVGTDNLVVNDTVTTVPPSGWQYYTLTAATTGFFDVTLTTNSGTVPGFYLTYLGDTSSPTGACNATNWAACNAAPPTPIKFSNYFLGNGFSRQVGLNISSVPVSYTLQAIRVGSMPQGCAQTIQNSTPFVSGSSASNTISSATAGTSYYYLVVNNSSSSKSITITATKNFSPTQDKIEIDLYDRNNCSGSLALLTSANTCGATNPCTLAITNYSPIHAGDFHLIGIKILDGDGTPSNTSGTYSLSISY